MAVPRLTRISMKNIILEYGREYFSDNMLTSPESSSMELCNNCGCPFWEDNFITANPAEALGDSYLCQACKEEFGMLNLMGFGE